MGRRTRSASETEEKRRTLPTAMRALSGCSTTPSVTAPLYQNVDARPGTPMPRAMTDAKSPS